MANENNVKMVRDLVIGDRLFLVGEWVTVTNKNYQPKKTRLEVTYDDGSRLSTGLPSRRWVKYHS